MWKARSLELLPAFLGRDLHLDRRYGERTSGTADYRTTAPAAGSWLAAIAPPPAIAPLNLAEATEPAEAAPAGLRPRSDRATTPPRGVATISLRALAAPLPQRSAPGVQAPPAPAVPRLAAPAERPVAARAITPGTTMAHAAARLGIGLPGSPRDEAPDVEEAFFASAPARAKAPSAAHPEAKQAPIPDEDAAVNQAPLAVAEGEDEVMPGPVLRARPASLWRRLLASAVDGVLVLAVGALYLALAHLVTGHSRVDGLLLPALALLLLVAGVYAAVGSLWGGRTLGLHLAGIRLVDGRGQAPDPMRALVRTLLGGVSAALLGGGFWLALVDRRGQTLHDKLTSTFLVQPI